MRLAALILILMALLIKYGKMYFLIAGYNTMSNAKRRKYNIKKIANLYHNTFMIMALAIIIGFYISKWFNFPIINRISFFISLVGIPYLLIRINSKKYISKD